MRSVVVFGSLPPDQSPEKFRRMGQQLGRSIVRLGLRLITGGSTDESHIDKHAAEGALAACEEENLDGDEHLLAVVRHGAKSHGLGPSKYARGVAQIAKREALLQNCDAGVVVGGAAGTWDYVYLCGLKNVPVVPLPMFQGAAAEVFDAYMTSLPPAVPDRIKAPDFESLDRVLDDEERSAKVAESAIALAKRCFSDSNLVIVSMSFEARFDNVNDAINEATERTPFVCERIDQGTDAVRIDDEIERKIRSAKLVIADLTTMSPNVFYEFGYARGSGVLAMPIAERGTELPFNVRSLRTVMYDPNSLKELKEDIRRGLPDIEEGEQP